MINTGTLFAGLLFGAIGLFAFQYGKRQANFKMLGIGIALMAYPYFISDLLMTYVVGIALVGALFLFRD